MNWVELNYMAFLSKKINFGKAGLLPAFKMELFVTRFYSWTLLTSVASSLDPYLLDYNFQGTEEGCSDMNSLVVRVDGGRPNFVSFQTQNGVRISMKLFLKCLAYMKKHFPAELQKQSRWRTQRSKNHEKTHSYVEQKL